jgi:hypothetical protein
VEQTLEMEKLGTNRGACWFGALLASLALAGSGIIAAQSVGMIGGTVTLLPRAEWGVGTQDWMSCGPDCSFDITEFRLGFVAVWKSIRVR